MRQKPSNTISCCGAPLPTTGTSVRLQKDLARRRLNRRRCHTRDLSTSTSISQHLRKNFVGLGLGSHSQGPGGRGARPRCTSLILRGSQELWRDLTHNKPWRAAQQSAMPAGLRNSSATTWTCLAARQPWAGKRLLPARGGDQQRFFQDLHIREIFSERNLAPACFTFLLGCRSRTCTTTCTR